MATAKPASNNNLRQYAIRDERVLNRRCDAETIGDEQITPSVCIPTLAEYESQGQSPFGVFSID